jgi:hypothetical protein
MRAELLQVFFWSDISGSKHEESVTLLLTAAVVHGILQSRNPRRIWCGRW